MLVLSSEPPQKSRFLIAADEGHYRDGATGGIEQKHGSAEQQCLADDCCAQGDVHGVANVSVQSSNDQMLRGRNR